MGFNMTTQTSTTLKTAGTNILMQLVAYLLQKVTDKNTAFADTKTAITTVALQAGQELIVNQLAKTTTPAPDQTTTIAQ